MTEPVYGLKITTILNAADKLAADLEYLCALIEHPDAEFAICDAVIYSRAVSAVATQLDFIVEGLSQNELSEDEECVTLSNEEIQMLNVYTNASEDALAELEEICGISLQNN